MSKKCAKCEKTVYPVEEFRCLDKTWHRACFRCWECGLALNMKNYKGYNKLPYCVAHYPSVKFTSVADTPENARLAQNTKLQSQLQYHSEFEEAKGKYTAVADDAETLRIKQNQKNISQLQYHSEFEEAKGKYTSVADDPETLRILQNQKNISQVKYHEEFEKNVKGTKITVADDPETLRTMKNTQIASQIKYHDHITARTEMERRRPLLDQGDNMPQNMGSGLSQPGSIADYNPAPDLAPPAHHEETVAPSPYSARNQGQSTVYGQRGKEPYQQQPVPVQQQMRNQPPPQQQPQPPPQLQSNQQQGPKYRAMYDYDAADSDEVSFREGDIIINTESIDEGWMTGTVQRTGQQGMLPANYVQKS